MALQLKLLEILRGSGNRLTDLVDIGTIADGRRGLAAGFSTDEVGNYLGPVGGGSAFVESSLIKRKLAVEQMNGQGGKESSRTLET